MKQFIEYLSRSLAVDQNGIIVNEYLEGAERVIIELHIPHSEMGKLIGKHGQMAEAIRTIIAFYGKRNLKKSANFYIVNQS